MQSIRLTSQVDEITLRVDKAQNNIEGAILTISGFSVSEYRPRVGVQQRYGRSGGVATGDKQVDARTITMRCELTTEEGFDYYYIQALNKLIGFFDPGNGPFYLNDDQEDAGSAVDLPRRTQIELERESLAALESSLERRLMRGDLTFTMLDGFWETQELFSYNSPSGGLSDNDTFSVTNSSKFRAYPIYTFTALADISLFRLTNTTTDVFIEIGSANFLTGEELIVNTQTGAVTVGGVNIAASALSDGSSFPDMIAGDNTFSYESSDGAVELTVEWRERYAR